MNDDKIIKELELFLGLSTYALSKALELKNAQTLYDIHNGKHGISKDLAERISSKYFNINKSWLLTGEGKMLKNTEAPLCNASSDLNTSNMISMPREVWEVIKNQSDSLKIKDEQTQKLIDLLRLQLDKTNTQKSNEDTNLADV